MAWDINASSFTGLLWEALLYMNGVTTTMQLFYTIRWSTRRATRLYVIPSKWVIMLIWFGEYIFILMYSIKNGFVFVKSATIIAKQ